MNGKPSLMCKSRRSVHACRSRSRCPMKTFPLVRDLVTDVSWNYEVNKRIPAFSPPAEHRLALATERRRSHAGVPQVHRSASCVRTCATCFARAQLKHQFAGPRFLVRIAGLEMHPMNGEDRTGFLKDHSGIGLCNITKCCTEVCPEGIPGHGLRLPLKGRVVDRYYDPLRMLWDLVRGKKR